MKFHPCRAENTSTCVLVSIKLTLIIIQREQFFFLRLIQRLNNVTYGGWQAKHDKIGLSLKIAYREIGNTHPHSEK